jgi:hypothetical protein
VVAACLVVKYLDELLEFLRILVCKVMGLAWIVVQVVEFPRADVEVFV